MNETRTHAAPRLRPRHAQRSARRRLARWRRRATASVGALAVVVTSLIVPAALAAPTADALASGVLVVDAAGDGVVTTAGRAGEVDRPLPGATVTLIGSMPDHPGWSTQTAADGSWSFPADQDYSASPGPFTVTIDVAGVAGDVYATSAGAGTAFTPVSDQPQRAVSAPFDAEDGPVVLDGLVHPVWKLDLALAGDPAGYDGKAVYTGSAPFDDADGDGQDSSAANDRVRSGDVVAYHWSLTAAHDVAVADGFPNATFEQTLALDDGARANFAQIPAICESGSITAFPSGQTVQPMTDPPAGTESVVLTCNLGAMGEDRSARVMPTSVWVSGNSAAGTRFSTFARAYATDAAGAAVARPAEADAGPVEITAVPRFNLQKWGFTNTYQGTATFNGVPNTPVMNLFSVITISADRRVGAEAFQQPITIDEDFWAAYTSAAGQNGPEGTIVPDLKYQISSCGPAAGNVGGAVYGYPSASWPEERAVSSSGTCTVTRDDPSDLTSAYSLTFEGIDTTGKHYPTQSATGTDLSAGPFYVASYQVVVQVPLSELDRAQGAPNDNTGQLAFYNRVSGFDPDGLSGVSNYGDDVEPGYCEPGPTTDGATKCDLILEGETFRSDNVVGPVVLSISPPSAPGWSKHLVDNTVAWSSGVGILPQSAASHDGAGQVQPGQVHGSRLTIVNSWLTPYTGIQQCDVFDNTVARLAPLRETSGRPWMATLPDDLYSYVVTGNDAAANQAFDENFTIEYAHVDLTGDDPYTGTFDRTNNRWEGDWSRQRAITCSDVPESAWQTDPNDVPGGIDEVNIARMRAVDGFELTAGAAAYWWLAFRQRDTFHGGPHDGETIPSGTIFANFGRYRTDQWNPGWNNPDYVPGTGMTGGAFRIGESGSTQGDRWTVVRAAMALSMRTISADVGGTAASGVADVGSTGTAVAGRPVVWEIVSSLTADAENPAAVDDVVITATLPRYAMYDKAATAAVEGGTPASSYTVNPDGTTTLTWNLGSLVPNQPIPPLRIVTDTDPLAPNNTALVNTATVRADGIPPVRVHTDDHTVRLEQSGEVLLKKSVDATLDLPDGQQSYTLQVRNFAPNLQIDAPTVIDVLPYVGDGSSSANVNRAPASQYAGTNRFAGVPEAFEFDGETPLDGTFYYATVPAAQVPQSLSDDTNPAIWSTTFTREATAFKFVAAGPLGAGSTGSKSGLTIRYTTEQSGNAAGDLYANRFTAFSETLKDGDRYQLLASNQTTVRVLGFSLGDFIWTEVDFDGKYTPGVDAPAPAGVTVEVFDAGDDSRVATTVTDEQGRWVVNDLPQGDYYAVIPASQFAAGGPLAGLVVFPGAQDEANDDTNEDVGHDGLPVEGGGVRTSTITLDATVAADGSITGHEPLDDNVGDVTLPPFTTDDFTNLTLDVALYPAPGYTFTKTADPVSGTAVAPGDTVAYTLVGKNTGGTPLEVVMTDDLSGVLAHAVLDPVAIVDDLTVLPAPTVEGATLSWAGTLQPGQSVRITYVVQVNPDAWGVRIHNLATSTATPPVGPAITPPQVETEHPTPGYGLTKTADPVSGTAVDQGQEITYTLTGANTGLTVLDPVTITDDLTGVLAHADLIDGSLAATVDGTEASAPTLEGTDLSWVGRLEPGQDVVITYTVRVHADAEGVVVHNLAGSSATPPDGLAPIIPPRVETFHPTPGYTFVKTADPVSGTPVPVAGQVTYTLTGTNHGATVLDPVTITDDLTGVLAHATLVEGSLTATIDGEPAPAPTLDGTTLSWTGRLEPGQQVTVTYTVTVNQGTEGEVLHNLASSTATPPTGTAIVSPDQETVHPVPGYAFVKTSDPGDGATITAGGTVTYTLSGTNIGASTLGRVTVTDDLTRVLAHARLDGDPVATITGPNGAARAAAAPTTRGSVLGWVGDLEIGETVTVTYTVVVDEDCPESTLVNVALSAATPPGSDSLTPPPGRTTHPITPGEPGTPGDPGTPKAQPTGPSWLPRTGAQIGTTLAVIALLVATGTLLITRTRFTRTRRRHTHR